MVVSITHAGTSGVGQEMPFSTRTIVVIGIGVLMVMVLFPFGFAGIPLPLGSEKQFGNGWVKLIYDYQSLIAGALAIAAALITVWGMKQIDQAQAERQRQQEEAQAKRHMELMERGLRAEIIKLERAINPQRYLIEAERIKLSSIDLSVQPFVGLPGDPQRRLLSAVCVEYWAHANGIRVELEMPQFVEAVPLFDGALMHALDQLKKKLADVLGPLGEHVMSRKDNEPDIYYEERLEEFIDGLLRDMAVLPFFISQFTESFDRFREKNSI